MTLNGNQIEFRVTTEELKEASEAIWKSTMSIQQHLEMMQEEVQMTTGYWEGEAGDICRSAFQEYREGIDSLIARLTENVTDLEKIAGIYEESEKDTEQMVESLPDDIII